MASRMPKISEAGFQQQVIQMAKLRGWKVAHFRGVQVTRRDGSTFHQTPVQADGAGFPDLVMLRGARQVSAELKVPPNKPTDRQMAWLAAFAMAGAETFVWTPDDWPLIEKTLE